MCSIGATKQPGELEGAERVGPCASSGRRADAWAAENEDLLRLVWESFDQEGDWPQGAELTRRHFATRPRRDYAEIGRLMPPQLGRPDPTNDGRIMLTPRGLSYLPSAAPLLQAFIDLVRRAIRRYENTSGEPTVAAHELPELLGVDSKLAGQLEQLAVLDTWVLRPAGGFPGAGDLKLDVFDSAALVVADVETIHEYLRLQLQTWYPDPAVPGGMPMSVRPAVSQPVNPAKVMVVHGGDMRGRNDLFALLRAMGLQPIEWNDAIRETETGTPYTGEAVEAAFRIAQAAVVLCTPDEEVLLREDLRNPDEPAEAERAWQPRPNVFFEGGIAFTRHPKRTIVLELGRVRIASDLLGRNVIRIGAGMNWRHDLAERLRTAACDVDTHGSDWLITGAFVVPQLPSATERAAVPDRAVTPEGPGPIMRGICHSTMVNRGRTSRVPIAVTI